MTRAYSIRLIAVWLALLTAGQAQVTLSGTATVTGQTLLCSTPSGAATPLLVPYIGATGNNALANPSPVLAFGKQGITTSSPAIPISISNVSNPLYCASLTTPTGCGAGSMTVSSMAISGTNAGDFALSGTCSTIASGADCEPTIEFTPTAGSGTNETALLTVNYTGATVSSQTMNLTGTSSSPTLLSTSSCPTALSGSTTYQLTGNISCAGTAFTIASAGVDLNLNGHSITYGTSASLGQVNAIEVNGANVTMQVHNGTFVSGSGANTFGPGHPQSSVIGYVSGGSMSPTIISSFFNLTFNYGGNTQYANAIEDNNGLIVVHDNIFNNTAVGTCATVGCRDELQGTPIYTENVSSVTSGASLYYNNTVNGGPQGGMQSAAPAAVISYNFLNPGNVTGTNTNNFSIYAWGTGQSVHDNVILTPLTGGSASRGISLDAAQTPSQTGVNINHNIVGAFGLANNSEYSGCALDGSYGLQIDDDPIGPNTMQNNYAVGTASVCPSTALRVTDSQYTTNVSENSTYLGVRPSGLGACVADLTAPGANCAYAAEFDGPTGFTSTNDAFQGDSGDLYLDVSGATNITIQSPIFKEGSNPSLFFTIKAQTLTVAQGGGPVSNFNINDATFNTGTGPTNIYIPQFNVNNMGPVSVYINWTQTMQVNKASGPAVSGAVVTWTDTLSNTYTCTTNGSGTCTVALTQYRDNNDTGANQIENRNPYSLSIPFAGCTTYSQSSITISATGTRNISLSGC